MLLCTGVASTVKLTINSLSDNIFLQHFPDLWSIYWHFPESCQIPSHLGAFQTKFWRHFQWSLWYCMHETHTNYLQFEVLATSQSFFIIKTAQLTATAFNQLGQCAKILVTVPTIMQRLLFSSLEVAVTIASTHFVYWVGLVAWLNTRTVYPWMVTHLSTNLAWRRITSLMCPTTLALSQTATLITF